MKKKVFLCTFVMFLLFAVSNLSFAKKDVEIITLTQIPCQFEEIEKGDKIYKGKSFEECEAINKETLGDRDFIVLRLKPGKKIFRVTNKNVDYELGFWLRGKGAKRVFLPSVSGGGLYKGVTKDYEVNLKSGEYIYSCPLNPTPDYKLIVE